MWGGGGTDTASAGVESGQKYMRAFGRSLRR